MIISITALVIAMLSLSIQIYRWYMVYFGTSDYEYTPYPESPDVDDVIATDKGTFKFNGEHWELVEKKWFTPPDPKIGNRWETRHGVYVYDGNCWILIHKP